MDVPINKARKNGLPPGVNNLAVSGDFHFPHLGNLIDPAVPDKDQRVFQRGASTAVNERTPGNGRRPRGELPPDRPSY